MSAFDPFQTCLFVVTLVASERAAVLLHGSRYAAECRFNLQSKTIHSGDDRNGDPGGDEVQCKCHSRPPSEPFSIVLLKRTSAAVAMASFI